MTDSRSAAGVRSLGRDAIRSPAIWLLLLGLVVLSTARSLGNGFAFDDIPIILENAQVHAVSPPWVYAQQSYWPPRDLGDAYRPWTVWALALQWGIAGATPWLFHLVSLLLTAAVTGTVFLLAAELLGIAGAIAAAALFAVHPVHVEATGNVVGQGELWMTLFSVAAAVSYLRARRSGAPGPGARLGIAALLVLAAASKEQGIVLPGLLLLLEWLAVPAAPGRRRLREIAPTFGLLAVVGLGFLAARYAVLGDLGGGPPAAGLAGRGIAGRAMVMAPLVVDWARLLVWPRDLLAQYSPPAQGSETGWTAGAAAGAGVITLAVALLALTRRRAPAIAIGLGWIAIAILPVGNVLFPTGVLVAERTLLLPSVGIVLVAGGMVEWILRGSPARFAPVWTAVAVLIGAGAARSFSRQGVWRDNPTLFAQTIVDEPRSYRAWFVFGRELVRRGEPDRAARMFAEAARLHEGDHRIFEEWGQVLRVQQRCDLAIPIFARGVAADPRGTLARSRLFECLMTERRHGEAAEVARSGVALGNTEFETPLARALEAGRSR